MIRLKFLGATGSVTGSKTLVETTDGNFLLDCGLYQGKKYLRERNWSEFPVYPGDIHSILLTHAHIDHSGFIPVLVKKGFRGSIYCTKATSELCDILLPDSGHIQEEDAELANRLGYSKHRVALPLYTAEEAKKSLQYFKTVEWSEALQLGEFTEAKFMPAGHIAGAAIVELKHANTRILFSGDLGRSSSQTMNSPQKVSSADYLVLESTYGNRNHDTTDPMEELEAIITEIEKTGGRLLIPAFAVGRTQKILYLIYLLKKEGRIGNLPVYLDSPMAIRATELFCKYVDDHALTDEECREMTTMTRLVGEARDSKKLTDSDFPAIILSASGMATGGRILHHLKSILPGKKNTVLFAGFQSPGTRGDRLIRGASEIKIHGDQIPVHASIRNIESLSAHADVSEIMAWLRGFTSPPRKVFLNHGEQDALNALKQKIELELGWEVVIPDYGDAIELS